jgi:Raf kinase inhibitor-like YbhB/YbcL family protein
MPLTISSPVFSNNQPIPKRFSHDGGNVSPPVSWKGAPPDVKSYALVVEDPDAPKGTFRHWAAYDIPPQLSELPEGAGSDQEVPDLHMARNDFGSKGYDGPQPPAGHGTHHYHFRLFALDVPGLKLPASCSAGDVLDAARSHSIASAEVVGTFER